MATNLAVLQVRQQIKASLRLLRDADGFTPVQIADVMGYESSEMVYKIASENTDTLPGADHLIYGSQRLSEWGNQRLARLAHSGLYLLKRVGEFLTNGCFSDERREINRALLAIEDACEARNWAGAESQQAYLEAVVGRCRAEIERRKGQQHLH